MELDKIIQKAQYQRDNWEVVEGRIDGLYLDDNALLLNVKGNRTMELEMTPNTIEQFYNLIQLRGTYKDWNNDRRPNWQKNLEILQRAIDKRLEQRTLRPRLSGVRIQYDINLQKVVSLKTQKYQIQPNLPVINEVVKQYGENIDENHSSISDDHLILTTSRVESKATKVGSVIGFGTQVFNSATGANMPFGFSSSLGCGQFFEVLWCSNGATSRETIDVIKFPHVYNNMILKLRKAMEVIINPTNIIDVINKAIDSPAYISELTTKKLSKYTDIPNEHHEGIIKAHDKSNIESKSDGINRWELFNDITYYNSNIYRKQGEYNMWESQRLMRDAYAILEF